MCVMGDDRAWCGVPTKMASVFELLSWRTFFAIHVFISSRQVLSVDEDEDDDADDDDDDDDDDDNEDNDDNDGPVFIYSCVSSA